MDKTSSVKDFHANVHIDVKEKCRLGDDYYLISKLMKANNAQWNNCCILVPNQSPGSFVVVPLTSTGVRAAWKLPPSASWLVGSITGFKLLYKRKSSVVDPLRVVTIESNSTLTIDVTGLGKYTEYEFQVLAFSSAGDGPRSPIILIRTFEDGKEWWKQSTSKTRIVKPIMAPYIFNYLATH